MCESCNFSVDRRTFLGTSLAAAAFGRAAASVQEEPQVPPRQKEPPLVWVVFLYPPAEVVYAGEFEDLWRAHRWFTWPGNQFQPEEQERKFTENSKRWAGG